MGNMFVSAAESIRRLVHHAKFLSRKYKLPTHLPYTHQYVCIAEVWQAAGTFSSQISVGNAEHCSSRLTCRGLLLDHPWYPTRPEQRTYTEKELWNDPNYRC